MAASFRVGDKVVYPNHGVGIIEHISAADEDRALPQFYQLRIEASNLRVMVPFGNAESVGLRPPTPAAELAVILAYLEQSEAFEASSDWKGRFRVNSEKMRQGVLEQVAEVLKSLAQLNQAKPLSFREKKMLDRAAFLLAAELACARKVGPEQALAEVQSSLAKAGVVLPPADEEDGHS
ncbi:MAG: CarD family transcriptional regulator [Terriglobales bacterium]